jgi:hypothetical protein
MIRKVDLLDCMGYVVVFDDSLRQSLSIRCIIAFSLRIHEFTGAGFLDELAARNLDHNDAVVCNTLRNLLGIHVKIVVCGSQCSRPKRIPGERV